MTTETAQTWTLTDEHRAQIPASNQKWIDVIMSVAAMDDNDRRITTAALHGMYGAANLPHDGLRVVYVANPLMGAVVAGVAAAIEYRRGRTDDIEGNRYDPSPRPGSILGAMYDAAAAAVRAATGETAAGAEGHTLIPVPECGPLPEKSLFRAMLDGALSVGGDTEFVRECVARSWNMRGGGNHWASWCAYLSFVRDVVGFRHPTQEAYAHYEAAAIHSCWRHVHAKFSVVSDRPAAISTETVQGRMRLHHDTEPAMLWRGGWALWYVHGIEVPANVVSDPASITLEDIAAEGNADVLSIMRDRYGWGRYLADVGAEVVDTRKHPRTQSDEVLYRLPDGSKRLAVTCPTGRQYFPGVAADLETCEGAQAWMSHGLDALAIDRS